MKVAGQSKKWLINVSVYSLAGSVSSALVGALLGLAGKLVVPTVGSFGVWLALGVAVATLARESGWLTFRLPQLRRQTRDVWSKLFAGPVAAALWGFDLGLIFTTWLTFSGVWLLVVVALLSRSAAFGAALFATYWLGRALTVWIAPFLLQDANHTPYLLDEIAGQYRLFQRMHALGLGCAMIILVLMLIRGVAIGS